MCTLSPYGIAEMYVSYIRIVYRPDYAKCYIEVIIHSDVVSINNTLNIKDITELNIKCD